MARPQKVLHILNSAAGGAALSTIGIIESLKQQGIDACAVCHSGGSEVEREHLRQVTGGAVLFTPLYWWNRKVRAKVWKRPLIELMQLRRTGFRRGSVQRVVEFAREHGADLIHTNTICTPEGGAAAQQLGLPHVWHLRELLGPGRPFRLPLEGPALGRYMAERCSRLVANSEVTASTVRAWLPEGLLEIVPNGIDLSRYGVKEPKPDGEPLVVAMVGSITSAWKKHPLFVEAAARVDRALPLEFRIYGHDPSEGGRVRGNEYADALQDLIDRHDLRQRFTFPGFKSDPVEIMSEIDILVHVADHESFGRVIVEGMATGLPVVGVRGGGVGEIVVHDQTGILAVPDDPQGLAEGIERLGRDRELRRTMGLAGRQRAEETYSLESCAAGILRVYEAVMNQPVRGNAA